MHKIVLNLMKRTMKMAHCHKIPILRPGGILSKKLHLSSISRLQGVYLLDEDDASSNDTMGNNVNKYTERTVTCGDLRIDNVGQRVVLCGWLQYQRMNKFIILRDGYGETQLLISDKDKETQAKIESASYESIIKIKGTVLARPPKERNKSQKTGDIEVQVESFELINEAEKVPFNIREFQKANEALRMQYRYLDLRFPFMQRNLRVRSKMIMKMREFLINESKFVDVETPTLFKKTPGGAQEFIVPTRFPGLFYSLVQSPQQFKQMLMAGSIDRYFQIARCYRDETSRSDRQPEFTQLDIEMSFTNQKQIMNLVEDLLQYSWPEFMDPLPIKFPLMTYKEALMNYGCDSPDISFEFTLKNCTNIFKDKNAFFIVFPKEYSNLGKAIKESNELLSKQYSNCRLYQIKIKKPEDAYAKIIKHLGPDIGSEFANLLKIKDEAVIFVTCGDKIQALNLLGKIRVNYVDHLESLGLKVRKKGMHMLWIYDFPLFEKGDNGELSTVHHPFTAPHPEDIDLLENDPLKVRGLAYDLVLNGNEIGGGSIRIHKRKLQEKIFDMLNIDKKNMKHFLDMLSSGCPPHGGIALGLDRLMCKILGTSSIRDVIAFPKTFEGRDLISGAPSQISEENKKLYHIKTDEKR